MTSNELRQSFIDFFKEKEHKYYESASLIPDDKTLLLTVAGMVPFKSFFLGEKKSPFKRITTYQKCIRTNDLENVGITPRHHTFFEMLGNFSFGDYFKKEAILWSWEYITEVLKLDVDRLWITVYETDDEAYNIWKDIVKVDENKIVRLGEKDNWWAAGPIGSCGPCSEIHYDTRNMGKNNEELNSKPGDDGNRYLEIWNLVFTEWNRLEDGSLVPLPEKNIDTGAGLERMLSILQNKNNNFETDLFEPIISKIRNIINTNINNEEVETIYKIIADHIRAATFLISDGVLPSNEGRGYILKKLIRRAYGGGAILNKNIYEKELPFLYELVDIVIDIMKGAYKELEEKKDYIKEIIKQEEEKFARTILKGLSMLNDEIKKLKLENKNKLSSDISFKLYDTYGFPFEFTKLVIEGNKLEVSEKEFEEKLSEQINRSKNARISVSDMIKDEFIDNFYKNNGKTEFLGYDLDKVESKLIYSNKINNDTYELIFDKTVFYAESGGQVSDTGKIYLDNNKYAIVENVIKKSDIFIHYVKCEFDFIENNVYKLEINKCERKSISKNHTATHLLHQALRDVLGESVEQAGSQVDSKRLRFDFSYYKSITNEELEKIEKIVNEKILNCLDVNIFYDNLDDAMKKGAKALFTDKYGDVVRVVDINGYSLELCGGTHVENTSEIAMFKILSEQSKASGIRRIEAITSIEVYNYLNSIEKTLNDISDKLKVQNDNLTDYIDKYITEMKELNKENDELKNTILKLNSDKIFEEIFSKDGINYLFKSFRNKSIDDLKKIIDYTKTKQKNMVILLGSDNGSAIFVSSVDNDVIDVIKANDLVKNASQMAGGAGGGKPTFAQAGAKNGELVYDIINKLKEEIKNG